MYFSSLAWYQAEFLATDTRLKTLELLNNSIGVRGCTHLGKVLTQNDTLVNLILGVAELLRLSSPFLPHPSPAHCCFNTCFLRNLWGTVDPTHA